VPTPPSPPNDKTKRKVLIIHCHPIEQSYSTSLLNAVKFGLINGGHDFRVRKLYYHGSIAEIYSGKTDTYGAKTFPATLSKDERQGYYDMLDTKESRDNKKSKLSIEVTEAIDDLKWCDSIIFIYPTWWLNFPAVLKGYFDRVFLPGIAFSLPKESDKSTALIPCLTNINKIGVVTTYGATRSQVYFAGDNGRQFLSRGLRHVAFSKDCQLQWNALYGIDIVSEKERKNFLDEVKIAYSKF
jgi:putative NADPH-quinone reductase